MNRHHLSPETVPPLAGRPAPSRLPPWLAAWLPAAFLLASGGPAASAAAGEREATYGETVAPFVRTYCARCHGEERQRGEIDLESFEARYRERAAVQDDRTLWEKVARMLRDHQMPPRKRPQPSARERQRVLTWIEAELDRFDCTGPVDPGRVTLRRLNRREYNHTLRDLLGVDFRPGEGFPADDVGHGFDTIGDVLSLAPLLFEKYFDAAGEALALALAPPRGEDPEAFAEIHRPLRFAAKELETTAAAGSVAAGARLLERGGEAGLELEVPRSGWYLLRSRLWSEPAGAAEPLRAVLRAGGREVAVFEVTAAAALPRIVEVVARLEAGRRRLSLTFPGGGEGDPPSGSPRGAADGKGKLAVDWLEAALLEADGAPARPDTCRRLIGCRPSPERSSEECAREILARFVPRAWRRPLRAGELERLVALVLERMAGGDSFEESVAAALRAVLTSPHFLFRIEEPREGVHPLGDFELATRLSYFLWSSMPDDELFDLAGVGKLQDPEVLAGQVRRLLEDPRSRAFAESFSRQWLGTGALEAAEPDPQHFPDFDEELRRSMARETLVFFETVLREDRSILDFLDGTFTFVDERLARHYGIEGFEGGGFQRLDLEGSARGGVLTHASVLTVTSNPTRTSPVKRGKWILERILGTPPPPPPPEVEELREDQEAILSGSLRERLERHRQDPDCAVCHDGMDPLGFAFENFDALGRWRDTDGTFPIDPSGELPGGEAFDGPAGLRALLKARCRDFTRALAEKVLTYALGRGLEPADRCAVEAIVEATARNEHRFGSLILAVVLSEPFRLRRD